LLGQWLTSAAKLAKNLAIRLVFIASLIVLLPLAVLNRQTVTLAVNPLDVTRAAPETALTIPLFIALFAAFSFGLLVGWVMGYFSKNKSPRALPVARGMIKASQPKSDEPTISGHMPARRAVSAPFDGAAAQSGEESETSHAAGKSDAS
jgi:hypothetical protein